MTMSLRPIVVFAFLALPTLVTQDLNAQGPDLQSTADQTRSGRSSIAELPAAEKELVLSALETINDAFRSVQVKDFETASQKVRDAIAEVTVISEREHSALPVALGELTKRLRIVHAHVELAGFPLPPLRLIPMSTSDQDLSPIPLGPLAGASSAFSNPEAAKSEMTMGSEPMMASESKMTPEPSEVSFALTVAPLLREHCGGCHVETGNPRGGLDLNTVELILDSGSIDVGSGDESSLVRRMRGLDGNQMPPGNRSPVPSSDIQLISTWIDQGAKFDGESPAQSLRELEKTAFVSMSSPGEISSRRAELASQQWQLAGINGAIETVDTPSFHVVGNASADLLGKVAEVAEQHLSSAVKLTGGEANEEYFPGRATIFVFPRRYDYGEFVQMVQRRQVPNSVVSHWQYTGMDASVAIVIDEDAEQEKIDAILASPVYSLAVATRGDIPRWVADGVGTAGSIGRVRDKATRFKAAQEMSDAWAAMPSSKAFLDGRMSPQRTEAIGAAVASRMIDRSSRPTFNKMMRNISAGKPFDVAFATAYNMTIEQYVAAVAQK